MNETLSMVYYFPIVAVTRFGYNSAAFPEYTIKTMIHVIYYYACSAGKTEKKRRENNM